MVEYSIILNGNLHEDELPEDLPEETYDLWYDLSIIPDGMGCRVGPALERNGKILKHKIDLPDKCKQYPDIQCDCGRYMYWVSETELRCPVHGVIYQPIQRKLIDPLD